MPKKLSKTAQWMLDHPDDTPPPKGNGGAAEAWRMKRGLQLHWRYRLKHQATLTAYETVIAEKRKRAAEAARVADDQAAEVRRQLEYITPEELGWPGMTADELVASEWKCWFDEELRVARLEG